MTPEIKAAFHKFKLAHFKAVQTDTKLSMEDDARYSRMEKLCRQFWEEANLAEKQFLEMLG